MDEDTVPLAPIKPRSVEPWSELRRMYGDLDGDTDLLLALVELASDEELSDLLRIEL